jgi:hypothetical protein
VPERRVPARGAARPGETREQSAAQEGAGDHVPRGRRPATRAARTIPLGGGGRGFQEIQTLRQEIGILTKHSRPGGRPAPGAPAVLNPCPAGTQAGDRRGLPHQSSPWAPRPRRPASLPLALGGRGGV